MNRNVVVKKSRIHGKGVFAIKNYKRGNPILNIDDSHVVTDTSKLTPKNYDFDLDFLANKQVIWMQPPEKYINHSCDPNAYVKTINGTRKVVAMRNIKKGNEITYDYAINGYGNAKLVCNCSSKNCRKKFTVNYFKLSKSLQIKCLPFLDVWFKNQFKEQLRAIH